MVKISKKLAGCYIDCLPHSDRVAVYREVAAAVKAGKISKREALEAMSSRVHDLTDTVNLQYVE